MSMVTRADMLEVFNIQSGFDNIEYKPFFISYIYSRSTFRGHGKKLFKPICRLDIYRISWHDSCIVLVSSPRHSYLTLPYIVSHPSDIISHERSECDMMSEGCDTSVSDSVRVIYKNHALMFYLSLNCSIAVLA